MTTPFAIHGLGRIGRALLRVARDRRELELVAVGDRADAAGLARLIARDSVHGRYPGEIRADGADALLLDGRRVPVFRATGDGGIPAWETTGARIVVEATGTATSRAAAARHLGGAGQDGPEAVIVSALAPDSDLTVCLGAAPIDFDPAKHRVVSNASCTTNCLALLLRVLEDAFGVRHALMNEVHSYTGNQNLVDGVHADPRRGRAAALNIVPTYSAAPAAVERLLPRLAGRLDGQAVRVPTPDVALLDLVATLERPADAPAIHDAFRRAADGELRGLLTVCDEALVSSDHVGDPHSAIVDTGLTQSLGGELVRVAAWYDNEWGYAHRLADLLTLLGEHLP